MKTHFFRLSKNWLFWLLIVFQVMIIVCYSVGYANNIYNSKDRWYHSISEYNKFSDLDIQIENIQSKIKSLNSTSAELTAFEEKKYLLESIDIIEFLKKNNYSYNEIQESNVIYYRENDIRAYYLQSFELLWWLNVSVSIVLVGLIVNFAKTNGSRIFDILLHGRRKIFFRDFKVYMIVMSAYMMMQIIIVSLISNQFYSKARMILYYNNGEIKVLSLTRVLIWAIVSFVLSFGVVLLLHFCLSQLINNVFYYSVITAVSTIVLKYFLIYFSHNKFILALNITMDNVYENNMTIKFYLFALIFKYAFVGMLFVFTYFINKIRNVKLIAN